VRWLLFGFLVGQSSLLHSATGQQEHQQHAECRLVLRGYGRNSGRLGVAAAQLNCSSEWGPVPVLINSTHLQHHAGKFVGVEVVSSMDCATHATKAFPFPVYALLHFCSDIRLTILQPEVQDLVLDGVTSASAYQTAVLAFGGRISAKISQGHFRNSVSGPALVTLQQASLRADSTSMDGCTGCSGVGFMTLDNSSATIKNSIFKGMVSDTGAGVLVSNTSRVTVQNSSFSNITVKVEGGGIFVRHNGSLLVSSSSFVRSTAEQGAGIYMMEKSKVGLQGLLACDTQYQAQSHHDC
jgi:hypothetical protein